MAPRWVDIVQLQRRDHIRMEELLRAYEQATPDLKAGLYGKIVDLVTQHAFAEETVLFPAARRLMVSAETITTSIEGKHQRINDLLAELDGGTPGEPPFEAHTAELFSLLRADAREEEDDLLTVMRTRLSRLQLRGIGAAWSAMRRTAPNRPHPRVPRRPPWNALAGIPLSLADRAHKLREAARKLRPLTSELTIARLRRGTKGPHP